MIALSYSWQEQKVGGHGTPKNKQVAPLANVGRCGQGVVMPPPRASLYTTDCYIVRWTYPYASLRERRAFTPASSVRLTVKLVSRVVYTVCHVTDTSMNGIWSWSIFSLYVMNYVYACPLPLTAIHIFNMFPHQYLHYGTLLREII